MGKRDKTEENLRAQFEELKKRKVPVGVASFSRHAGIDRSYLYTFTELAAEISAYARETQPDKSRRGPGISIKKAKQRALDSQKLREHAQWSKLVPELNEKVSSLESDKERAAEELATARRQLVKVRGAYEYLLLIAVEAGVSPSEIEKIQAGMK